MNSLLCYISVSQWGWVAVAPPSEQQPVIKHPVNRKNMENVSLIALTAYSVWHTDGPLETISCHHSPQVQTLVISAEQIRRLQSTVTEQECMRTGLTSRCQNLLRVHGDILITLQAEVGLEREDVTVWKGNLVKSLGKAHKG